jgi:hypothetical protein
MTLNCHSNTKVLIDRFVDNTGYFSRIFGHYGMMDWIGSLGSYVSHRSGNSYHNTGEAMDLSYVRWRPRAGSTVPIDCRPCDARSDAAESTTHRRLVAVEAGLRKQFKYVLNRGIRNHTNHFHVDDVRSAFPAGLLLDLSDEVDKYDRRFSSGAYFIQDCILAFTDEQPEYDGIWGPESRQGLQVLLTALGMNCLDIGSSLSSYRLFLDYIMMHGFADAPAGTYSWGGPIPRL